MYVDDKIIKFINLFDYLAILEEVLTIIKKNHIRINHNKYAFGVIAGKYLGFMLTKRGIQVNSAKCKAILDIKSLAKLK